MNLSFDKMLSGKPYIYKRREKYQKKIKDTSQDYGLQKLKRQNRDRHMMNEKSSRTLCRVNRYIFKKLLPIVIQSN